MTLLIPTNVIAVGTSTTPENVAMFTRTIKLSVVVLVLSLGRADSARVLHHDIICKRGLQETALSARVSTLEDIELGHPLSSTRQLLSLDAESSYHPNFVQAVHFRLYPFRA